ncbi:MAG: acyltransferase [Prevotellaceae bacterium]|jgi:hypothetical protein|nr:acyltransferase [Prevotellaceae bacterium]
MNNDIFSIKNDDDFLKLCMDVFHHQAKNCKPYCEWINLLNINIKDIKKIEEIPFLPIELFKSKKVYCCDKKEQIVFSSSSTTGTGQSFHYVADTALYEKSFTDAFCLFYGNPGNYAILGLLPSYLERTGSSLVYMVDNLIKQSNNKNSGFFLHDHEKLYKTLCTLKNKNISAVLIGVTYALLDFAEKYSIDFPQLTVMETGGMKGRREEISRAGLHEILCCAFGVRYIHSEYGMTELLSQAYSNGNGEFLCPAWMKILVRDIHNPFKISARNASGAINIVDLANRNSCSFIATHDLGKIHEDCRFEILGRLTASDIRGCNLLVQ